MKKHTLLFFVPLMAMTLAGCGNNPTPTSVSPTSEQPTSVTPTSETPTSVTPTSEDPTSKTTTGTSTTGTSTTSETPVILHDTIAEIAAKEDGSDVNVQAVVMCVGGKNVMLYDETGIALLYLKQDDQGRLAAGQYIRFAGQKTTFKKGVEITVTETTDFYLVEDEPPAMPTAIEATASELNSVASFPLAKRYTGVAKVIPVGKYYDFVMKGSKESEYSTRILYASFGEKNWLSADNENKIFDVDLIAFQINDSDNITTCCLSVQEIVEPVTSVSISGETQVSVGGSTTLTATILPESRSRDAVEWSVDHEEYATIENGVVTGVAEGTINVVAKVDDVESEPFTMEVTAAPISVTSITLDKTAETLEVSRTLTLTATVLPDNATDKSVTWTSSNEQVATVVEGVVTALAVGETTITCASVSDPNVGATCRITVIEKVLKCDFTTKAGSHSQYNDEWVYDEEFNIYGGANYNGEWDYAKFGKKDLTNQICYVKNINAYTGIKTVVLNTNEKNLSKKGTCNEWGLKVYDAEGTLVDSYIGSTMTPSTAEQLTITLDLSKVIATNSYSYEVYFDTTGNGDNGIVWINSIFYNK